MSDKEVSPSSSTNVGDQILQSFSARCKDVFNFDAVQLKNKAGSSPPSKEDDKDESSPFSESPSTKARKGQESLFRVPDPDFKLAGDGKRAKQLYEPPKRNRVMPPPPAPGHSAFDERKRKHMEQMRGRKRDYGSSSGYVPDFKRNPNKYTKYSLKDVDKMNNRSNSQAAFDFLRELKEQGEEAQEKFEVGSKKIVFKKREKKQPECRGEDKNEDKPSSSSSSKQRSASAKTSKKPSMVLNHLMHEDDDEDCD